MNVRLILLFSCIYAYTGTMLALSHNPYTNTQSEMASKIKEYETRIETLEKEKRIFFSLTITYFITTMICATYAVYVHCSCTDTIKIQTCD